MQLEKLAQLPDSPMWKQFAQVKRNALDALLFYRMGDFYELFSDDAVTAAEILQITLTARHKGTPNPVPMCGVPFHSATNYINKLLAHGQRVAICEQMESPVQAKGIVKREIVRIVSPGMAFDHDALTQEEHNYLAAIYIEEKKVGQVSTYSASYCAVDASTGEFLYGTCEEKDDLLNELLLLKPKELILSSSLWSSETWSQLHTAWESYGVPCITPSPDHFFQPKSAFEDLCRHFHVANLEAFGLHPTHVALAPLGAILRKLKETQLQGSLAHLRPPTEILRDRYLALDESTIDHLDLLPKGDRNPQESLFYQLNSTLTAMGARQLRSVLVRPLQDRNLILDRQNAIAHLVENPDVLTEVRTQLRGMRDLERIVSKIGLRTLSPRDLLALRDALGRLPELKRELSLHASNTLLADLGAGMKEFSSLFTNLNTQLREEVPTHLRDGNVFCEGWNPDLDVLIDLSTNGAQNIADMEARERAKTGIGNLKIKYNRVFGYYIEVTKAHIKSVPSEYQRKQTTVNSERYVTDELNVLEEKMLRAQDDRIRLELRLFDDLLQQIGKDCADILACAERVAWIDVLQSLAKVAQNNNYIRPTITTEDELEIEGGRHPVIEKLLDGDTFISNDVVFSKQAEILLITGPNMAGKSTFMRQVALLTLMAQTGSFIPAKRATIGIVDRIASRVGASDRIGRGQSTFMVEMNEMARILRQSTSRSLLIIDEIGRGTSTFDGLALAWAILEDIQSRLHARTLFATHYHELTVLEQEFSNVQNLSVLVRRKSNEVVFLHKVVPGKADGSYGVDVAQLAGLPKSILVRAREILTRLEAGSFQSKKQHRAIVQDKQLSFFSAQSPPPPPAPAPLEIPPHLVRLEREIRAIEIDQCSPLDALLRIKSLQEELPPQQ